jgi:hypothetical protein
MLDDQSRCPATSRAQGEDMAVALPVLAMGQIILVEQGHT